jgi:hypothetical protein
MQPKLRPQLLPKRKRGNCFLIVTTSRLLAAIVDSDIYEAVLDDKD